ncbi:MAG: type 2 isopentenyl-diphosphate Delta-isomerase [Methanoregulaceae archaeon]|nr:type 2 isopentenyl-diphosphate Delta-isomerase [Methanoregulaceae archaeon]
MTGRERGTSPRKLDHIRICCERAVSYGFTGFEDIRFVHDALPGIDMDAVDPGTEFLGRKFAFPLFIAAMTGGHPDTKILNRHLATAAEKYGIPMGVGSQRAAIEDPRLEDTFSVVRDTAPHAFLAANLGIVQLRDHGIEWVERAVEMIDGDAIAIHLNFLQEAIQPEGDHDATGCLDALRSLCEEYKYPVIVKETGSGISAETAGLLRGAGVQAIDIGGWGGTSWAVVEGIRAGEGTDKGDAKRIALGEGLLEWGIPTAVSLGEVAGGGPVIATGGIRTGVDMAKALRLGADLCGMALPLLQPAVGGEELLNVEIDAIILQLRAAMFLTGSRSIEELRKKRMLVTGVTREMMGSHWESKDGY